MKIKKLVCSSVMGFVYSLGKKFWFFSKGEEEVKYYLLEKAWTDKVNTNINASNEENKHFRLISKNIWESTDG